MHQVHHDFIWSYNLSTRQLFFCKIHLHESSQNLRFFSSSMTNVPVHLQCRLNKTQC